MSDITLNASMRSNLLSLKNIATQMDKTQLILATGKKVNSAIDNASSYYQARSLTNRAADLTALLDSMGQGIQTIEAANQGIEHAITMLEQAQAVANSALEKGEEEIIARVATEDELLAAIQSGKSGLIVIDGDITLSENQTLELKDGQSLVGASYLDKNVEATKLTFDFDVDNEQHGIIAGNNSLVAGLDIDFSSTYSKANPFIAAIYADGVSNVKVLDVNLNITSKSNDVGFYGVFGIMAKNGAEIEILGDSDINLSGYRAVGVFAHNYAKIDIDGQIDFFLNDSAQWGIWSHSESLINVNSSAVINLETAVSLKARILSNSAAFINIYAGASVSMITTGTNDNFWGIWNEYGPESSGYKPGNGILIEKGVNISVKATAEGIDFGGVVSNDLFLDQTGQSLGNPNNYPDNIIKQGTAQTYQIKTDTANKDADTFNKIIKEYDKLLSDCSYQGINLLKGGNLKVVFDENRTHVFNVLGQDITSKALNITEALWQTQGDIEEAINQLNTSITTLRSLAENLGNQYSIITTRINFTESLTDILETGADDLTLADMNEASAQYLSLQTRQQLAINSLSLASMSARSILSLFY